jgi:hypothetical protein
VGFVLSERVACTKKIVVFDNPPAAVTLRFTAELPPLGGGGGWNGSSRVKLVTVVPAFPMTAIVRVFEVKLPAGSVTLTVTLVVPVATEVKTPVALTVPTLVLLDV